MSLTFFTVYSVLHTDYDYEVLFVPLFARRKRLSYIYFSTLILCHRALWVKEDGSEKQVAIKHFQDAANLTLEQNHLNRLEDYVTPKGTVSRDFLLLILFMKQFPPSPRVSH
jgi:hypothetical protein